MALRRSLPLALAAGLAATLAATLTPAAAATTPIRLALPAPTGPDQIGTVPLHLVQNGREDPWVPGRPRELMVSLTYPARHADRYPTAPYMTPGAWAAQEQLEGLPDAAVVIPPTAAHAGAPVDRHPGGLPVVLYSPGYGDDRTSNTALVQDLASRGYLVATIDHTYEGNEVDFPDGRVARRVQPDQPNRQQITDDIRERAADTRFVLDELTAIDHGQNPDADHHRLPQGLRGALDLNRVGMFGHSLGGATALEAMHEDPRIKAAFNMDGPEGFGPVAAAGLDRPYLTMNSASKGVPSRELWDNSTGWKRELRLQDSGHSTYSDDEYILTQAESVVHLPMGLSVKDLNGTIDPGRAFTIESTYLNAFLDLHLRHHPEHLFDGPSPRFPEVAFDAPTD